MAEIEGVHTFPVRIPLTFTVEKNTLTLGQNEVSTTVNGPGAQCALNELKCYTRDGIKMNKQYNISDFILSLRRELLISKIYNVSLISSLVDIFLSLGSNIIISILI